MSEDKKSPVKGNGVPSRIGLEPGCIVAREAKHPFEIEGLVGRGIYGEVWRAKWGRKLVALKFLAPYEGETSTQICSYFEREIEMLGRVQHENVLALIGEGTSQYGRYFVSEWLHGRTLDQISKRLGDQLLRRANAYIFAIKICRGVQAIHQAGVGHFDLKPSNIMISGNRLKIIDFGLARLLENAAQMSRDSDELIGGTAPWTAPEVSSLNTGYAQSDVYSIALIVFWLFTGIRAFDEATREETFAQHRTRPRRETLGLFREKVASSDALADILHKALAKQYQKRYRSAGKLGIALLNAFRAERAEQTE